MPRRPRKTIDPGRKARVKSSRVRQRRAAGPDPDDLTWLSNIAVRQAAERVLNGNKVYPYWLSIECEGNAPVATYYPCRFIKQGNRVYYGFMFREHREQQVTLFTDARRELIDTIRALNIN